MKAFHFITIYSRIFLIYVYGVMQPQSATGGRAESIPRDRLIPAFLSLHGMYI